uniref:Uncharacterized protein n=1 Tax=Brassica campestris TaxID=3711 RepID=M4D0Z1_BRACM
MSMDAHRSTDHDEDRSIDYSRHRSTSSAESIAECSAVRIMTHEEFAEKHPYPPSPFYVKMDQPHEPAVDRQRETDIDRPPSPPIDRREPLTYRQDLDTICMNNPQPATSIDIFNITSIDTRFAAIEDRLKSYEDMHDRFTSPIMRYLNTLSTHMMNVQKDNGFSEEESEQDLVAKTIKACFIKIPNNKFERDLEAAIFKARFTKNSWI